MENSIAFPFAEGKVHVSEACEQICNIPRQETGKRVQLASDMHISVPGSVCVECVRVTLPLRRGHASDQQQNVFRNASVS